MRSFEKRLVIVGGKGGVGKSTVAAAIAYSAARRGEKTLLVDISIKERISTFFSTPFITFTPAEIRKNLFAIRMRPDEALKEYGLMKLKFKSVYKMVFENHLVKRILNLIPGMDELLLIGKVMHMEQERDNNGNPRWDKIVLDAPATGHGVSFLRLPHVILNAVNMGPLAIETRKIRDLLIDPERTCMHLVTLPEAMPFNETKELYMAQKEILSIPSGLLIINAVYPKIFNSEERSHFHQIVSTNSTEGFKAPQYLHGLLSYLRRRKMQEEYLERYREEFDLPIIELPFLFVDEIREPSVAALSDILDSAL